MAEVTKRPQYAMLNGIRYPAFFSPKCFKDALTYKPKADDVFIVTYPKCGTTWMQNIALYIFRKGQELENHQDILTMAPFIDMLGKQGIDNMPRPGALKTHLPYSHMPYCPEAKYIFVIRDPRDCCVSMFYHTRNNPMFGYWDATFDEFFELFIAGEVEYNDYFDHLLSWYPHRNDTHVFYTKYEDMKKDTKKVVLGLAKFLGQEYIEAIEKDNGVLNNILEFSGFDYMKKNLSEVYTDTPSDESLNDPNYPEGIKYGEEFWKMLKPPENLPELQFVRKGVVGDWKNHLSPQQLQRLTAKFLDRTKGTKIPDWYQMS